MTRTNVRTHARAAGTPFLAAASIALAVLAAGCASQAPAPSPRQPYKVVLLPVEGAERALAAQPETTTDGGTLVPLSFTTAEFEREITNGIRASNAFSEIVEAPANARAVGDAFAGDELAAAADYARSVGADLILRVTVKSARVRDMGPNSSKVLSTFMWFMLPLPIWTVDDRTYDTNVSVEAALYEPRDTVKPTASVVATSGKQELDLWDRGLSWWVPVVPPTYLEGNPKTVSEEVTRRAMTQVMAALAEELRTREIPSRFEMDVAPRPGGVTVTVGSRRQLRSIEVFADGKLVQAWAETDLVPEKDSTADRRIYRRNVAVGATTGTPAATDRRAGSGTAASSVVDGRANAGANAGIITGIEIRVVAEDESGGREVRTIVVAARGIGGRE